jgi:hypothetical protein
MRVWQVRAQRTRDRLVEEQRLRSKAEQEKVREAREVRESKTRAWREGMEEKLQKAEQLRESHLQEKRRKAQDEDTKVSEIAFINSLEAQNRKIQVLRRHQVKPPVLWLMCFEGRWVGPQSQTG